MAKSEQNGRICLYQHLKNVADIALVVANHQCLDEEIAVEGALLHDIGKTSPLFQQSIASPDSKRPGAVFRHEIASLFFISLVKEEHRNAVIDMVVAHHNPCIRMCGNWGFWIWMTIWIALGNILADSKIGATLHWKSSKALGWKRMWSLWKRQRKTMAMSLIIVKTGTVGVLNGGAC